MIVRQYYFYRFLQTLANGWRIHRMALGMVCPYCNVSCRLDSLVGLQEGSEAIAAACSRHNHDRAGVRCRDHRHIPRALGLCYRELASHPVANLFRHGASFLPLQPIVFYQNRPRS